MNPFSALLQIVSDRWTAAVTAVVDGIAGMDGGAAQLRLADDADPADHDELERQREAHYRALAASWL